MDLIGLHRYLAWFIVFFNALAGLLALVAHFKPALRKPSIWKLTVVAQVLLFVQAIIGVIVFQGKEEIVDEFHLFYGFFALATVGFMFAYREQLKDYIYLMYGVGGIFLMGLAIRAMQISAVIE